MDNKQKTPVGVTILTIILLLLITPIGLIVMWIWTKWSKTVKWVLTTIFFILPLVLLTLGVFAVALLAAVNPAKQIEKARLVLARKDVMEIINASNRFYARKGTHPESFAELSVSEGLSQQDLRNPTAYSFRSIDDGKDCEVTVVLENRSPIIVTCNGENSQFDAFILKK